MPAKILDSSKYAKPDENLDLTVHDSHKGPNLQIATQSAKQKLKDRKMKKQDRERALSMHFFIENLIPQGYHIILYGAAGSGKTTVVLHLCKMILDNHENAEVYYLFQDGQLGMAASYEKYLEKHGLEERYNIITEGDADESLSLIETMVLNNEVEPSELIVVLDTLKFLNRDILSKGANAEALHRIKALTNKGVTFITLHHTNKDGENFAGTAEIEQDSDALLKITTADGKAPHTKISTIKAGGRVRFFLNEKSFSFNQGKPTSIEMLDNPVDAEKLSKEKKDAHLISIIKGILTIEGELTKTELERHLKEDDDFDCSVKERKRILRTYRDKHWRVRKEGIRKQNHVYSVIDTTSQTIAKIQESIGGGPQEV